MSECGRCKSRGDCLVHNLQNITFERGCRGFVDAGDGFVDPRENPLSRISLLQRLPCRQLADYLAQELEAGVPVNWYDWLMEEV